MNTLGNDRDVENSVLGFLLLRAADFHGGRKMGRIGGYCLGPDLWRLVVQNGKTFLYEYSVYQQFFQPHFSITVYIFGNPLEFLF